LGNGFVPVHRGMDDNLCYISDKFLSDWKQLFLSSQSEQLPSRPFTITQ
jgi:hypothetical protein